TPEPDTVTAYVDLSYAFTFYERRQGSVDSCHTGDEFLDQQAMRDMLKASWGQLQRNRPPDQSTRVQRLGVRGFHGKFRVRSVPGSDPGNSSGHARRHTLQERGSPT